jgi:hypothetical protein
MRDIVADLLGIFRDTGDIGAGIGVYSMLVPHREYWSWYIEDIL